MIDDRNKTEITKLVTAAAFRYLDERGFKPVETEVPVSMGWVADLAGVISPTQTELQELKLLPPKPGWKKPQADREAWYALANKTQELMTALVEVKTSCSDFRGDKKCRVCGAIMVMRSRPLSLGPPWDYWLCLNCGMEVSCGTETRPS